MCSYGSQAEVGALAFQIRLYRTLDTLQQARESQDLALNNTAWQNHYNDLVRRYNQLLNDANTFEDKARKLVAEQDQRIGALSVVKNELEAENERLRLRLIDVEGDLAMARTLDKELHPEVYQHIF